MTTALTRKENVKTIRALLTRDDMKKQLAMAIPRHLDVDRLLRVAITSIQKTPALADCTTQSLLACVMTCAQLGLEPDQFTGQAYLVPFGREAQIIPGYRGLLKLARQSGEIQSVSAQVVYENDEFDFSFGIEEDLKHKPCFRDRGEPIGAYCVLRYKDGGHSFDFMTTEAIEKIRNKSKTSKSGPWVTDWDEMAKKTVLRRHLKLAPMSIEMATAVSLEDRAHAGESQVDILGDMGGETIDVTDDSTDLPDYDTLVSDCVDKKNLEKWSAYLELNAESHGRSLDEEKEEVRKNSDEYFDRFNGWMVKQTKKPKTKTREDAAKPSVGKGVA